MRATTIALLMTAALGIAACGDDDATTSSTASEPAATTATPAATETTPAPAAAVSKDTSKKPEIPKPTGDPPTKLASKDIVEGKGKAAKSGDDVTVQYVGVSFSTGEQFDASWDNGQPFQFPLGGGMVIPGWDQGVVGMKEGGRRQLTIPPDLAYGPQGQPPVIAPNETLVFVIDMVSIG